MRIETNSILVLFIFFLFSALIFTQTVIENPEKPTNPNAGRVVQLKEAFRITDESSDFYFKGPRNLKVAADDSIYLTDEEQFLKFSPEGKFIRNLYKKGQGPGEISGSYYYYTLHNDEIYIFCPVPRKIIHMDKEGNLIDEFSFKSKDYRAFYGVLNERFIFRKSVWPPAKERKGKLHDIIHKIVLVSKEGVIEKESPVLLQKTFMGQNYGKSWAPFHTAISDDYKQLYVCHTCEYLIESLDIQKGKVVRRFRRKYPRVKYKIKYPGEEEFEKKYNAPKKKFENDISELYFSKGLLLAKTSIEDKNKGILIDVFGREGQHIDNFYLKINGKLMAAHEDSIFIQELGENEILNIVKYKIVE